MGNDTSTNQKCSSNSIMVHVAYQATQRTIHLPPGSTLSELAETFLKAFNDVIPSGSNTSDFKFLIYDSQEENYTVLKPDVILNEHDKVKASMPWIKIVQGPVVLHPIRAGELVYIWSVFSNGLLILDDKTMTVKCDGTTDKKSQIHFKAVDVSTSTTTLCALTLPVSGTTQKVYVMKGQDENQDVVMEEMDSSDVTSRKLKDECKFESFQFFGDTQFRCYLDLTASGRTDLYITAMKDGTTKLQKGGLQGYPRPNTLFIASDII